MATLWGIPYLFIKLAVDDGVPPIFLAWARIVIAAVVLLALAWRAGTLGSLAGVALDPALRDRRDHAAVPAHRHRRAARRLLAGGDHHRRRAAARGAPRVPRRAVRARVAQAVDGPRASASPASSRSWASTSPAAPTSCSAGSRSSVAAAGYAAGPMIMRLRLGGMDARAAMGASLGIAARRADAVRDRGSAGRSADRHGVGVDRGARAALHRAGVPRLQRPGGRGRPRAGDRHHLRGAGRGARAGRRGARRAPGSRGDRGAAADPRRLVDLDRRPRAAGAGGDPHATPPADRPPRPIGPPRGGPEVWPVGPLESLRPSPMLRTVFVARPVLRLRSLPIALGAAAVFIVASAAPASAQGPGGAAALVGDDGTVAAAPGATPQQPPPVGGVAPGTPVAAAVDGEIARLAGVQALAPTAAPAGSSPR